MQNVQIFMNMVCKKTMDISIWKYSYCFMKPSAGHMGLRRTESSFAVFQVLPVLTLLIASENSEHLLACPRVTPSACMNCYSHINISADFNLRIYTFQRAKETYTLAVVRKQ